MIHRHRRSQSFTDRVECAGRTAAGNADCPRRLRQKRRKKPRLQAANASSKETAGDITAADSSNADTSDADNVYKDGTYTGEAQGFGGTIQVQVTLASDEITDIQVTSAPGEDSAYLSPGEGVISSILSAQSTDVDTISGATFSSTGIINAVVDALGKAEN